ncbi:MAG: DUF1553 domain-containing protein, partial [Verrucomicrobiota bacterium]
VDIFLNGEAVSTGEASVSFGKISIGNGKALPENVSDDDGSTGWSTATEETKRHELVLNLAEPIEAKGELKIEMLFERHFVAALGKFRWSATGDSKQSTASPGIPHPDQVSDREMRLAFVRDGEANPQSAKRFAAIRARLPQPPTTLVFQERPPRNPRPTFLHHRGEYLQTREEVPPAIPAVFGTLPPDQPANRLTFARWLVSEDNPLAARVAVNRAWRSFFGRGIIHTEGDFGYQSELPSHPELLDWLAVEFRESGWSLKQLHRLIVTSETYRRDSRIDSTSLEADPDNIWLARGPRFRITGEMIRDSVLQAAGVLSDRIGGESVFPPQPASVAELAYGSGAWTISEGEDRYRRSLYTFSKRTAPFAAYLTFDGPTGESCLPRRERSNTPLQALTLLNDAMYHDLAVELAKSVSKVPRPQAEIVAEIFQRILTRPPSENESAQLLAFLEVQRARLEAGELKADEIVGHDADATLASYALLSRALINLNEAITKG